LFFSPIILNYSFGEIQPIQFIVRDAKETIGELICTLGDIVSSHGGPFTRQLVLVFQSVTLAYIFICTLFNSHRDHPDQFRGRITVRAQEVSKNKNNFLHISLSGHDLDKKDFFGKSGM
jgi:hypothetical protein